MATKKKAKKASKRAVRKRSAPVRRKMHAKRAKAPRAPKMAGVKQLRVSGVKRSTGAHKLLGNMHVRNLLTEIAGEKALKVVGELTEPMSDEDLAVSAKTKISEVRAIMNKLHSARIASYSRTRNDEGWYTYTWDLCADRAHQLVAQRGAAKKDAAMSAKQDPLDYYVCPNCVEHGGKKFVFDRAVEIEFRCPECAEMLKYVEKKG